jgi:hypothetical protein
MVDVVGVANAIPWVSVAIFVVGYFVGHTTAKLGY